jgi:hypothetical protein
MDMFVNRKSPGGYTVGIKKIPGISRAYLVFLIILSFSLSGPAQDSSRVISPNQFLRYRLGYVVTINNDTIYGLICHDQMDGVFYLGSGNSLSVTPFKEQTQVPHSFPNKPVKSFMRNGILYQAISVPPDGHVLFLALLVAGPMTLYGLLGNYSDNGFERTIAKARGIGNLSYLKNYDDEYYLLKDYYVRKGKDGPLTRLPHEEFKFSKAFVPLVRDNGKFLNESRDIPYDFYHARALVELYNQAATGAEK